MATAAPNRPLGRLAGKAALITGGARGMGSEAVRLFAHEGARVVFCDVVDGEELAREVRELGGQCEFMLCDVSEPGQVHEFVEKAASEANGRVDILYNNAGVESGDGPIHELSAEAARRIIGINLESMLHTCREVIPKMIDGGGGAIVNTASVGGLVGTPRLHAYSASKGGIIAFTRSLAITYGAQGVRANVICPGATRTSMSQRLGLDWERDRAAGIPLGRIASGKEIAYAALFLASDEASFVTGAVLAVDGGRTAK
jgi:NAD(P)-dependent dehydrogenase (short-subunit alcohol dehydrogenase family)